jgi:DNA replication and repair protein RecF
VLTRFSCRGFRNLAPLDWNPEEGSHLLLGGNGAGKTSLLEAIYFLATTRSFRTKQPADCVRHGEHSFLTEGEVENDQRTSLLAGWNDGKRVRSVNGKVTTLGEHLAVLPVVSWATGDTEILTGAPQLRRRLLDRGILGVRPAAFAVLERFRQALTAKRQILSRFDESPPAELSSWNGVLAGVSSELIELRRDFVERLKRQVEEVRARVDLPVPKLSFLYRPSPSSGFEGVEEIFRSLEKMADRERRRGAPLLGPQRDELEIRWDGREIRTTASAGERKILSLVLVAALARTLSAAGREPVYLLDDADAELSAATLSAVWKVFSPARQLFATSSRPQVWLTLETRRVWQVEKGSLQEL